VQSLPFCVESVSVWNENLKKDWCMSLHGIAGPPVQSSPNSGNMFWITRPLALPNFVGLRQKVRDVCCQKLLTPVERGKLDQSSPKSLMTCYGQMSIIVPNFIALDHNIRKTCYNFFYPIVNFGALREPIGPKFTNHGVGVQQSPIYQCAKFRPVLTTCVQDIWCQTSLISLTAWSTNKHVYK